MNLAAELDQVEAMLLLPAILEDVERVLTRYIVFRARAQVTAVTLWTAHAHVLQAADVTPYLAIGSAEKGSGKTRLLEVLHELTPRPWHAVQPTEAVLFRRIHRDTPTLLLDETDALFSRVGATTDRGEAVRGVLNAGYRRGATVDRVNLRSKTPLESYRVYCAKAFAGIGTLPGTVADRSIPIGLARRARGEAVARFLLRDVQPELHRVRDALGTWAQESVSTLRDARPELPDALPDRAAEVWEPLLAVADLAGAEWPARARAAAIELHVGRTDIDSHGVALLRAIREVFTAADTDRLLTIDLLRALVEREAEPWPGWWGRDVDTADEGHPPRKAGKELAQHLRPYGVIPRDIRTPGGSRMGYYRRDFGDAWSRYLDPAASTPDDPTTVAAHGFAASGQGVASKAHPTPQTAGAHGLSGCRVTELAGQTVPEDEHCVVCGLPADAYSSEGDTWCVGCWVRRCQTEEREQGMEEG